MQKILVLGAGMVAGPLIKNLLGHDFQLTVTSLALSEAEDLVAGHPNGSPQTLDLSDAEALSSMVSAHDLVISLVPYGLHPLVAKQCLAHKKHMVTASYVSPEMAALDQEAREKGLIFLNEIGLDPGIDHMSAMRIIDEVHDRGGVVRHFRSYCGGLPSPEANDNPFGYKFSWAPRSVLLAGRNGAKYWSDSHEVTVSAGDLFRDMRLLHVPGVGDFEAYPNRDSMEYRDIYGLGTEVRTLFRATLRNLGWCDTLHSLTKIGMLDREPRPNADGTIGPFVREVLGAGPEDDLRDAVAARLNRTRHSFPPLSMEWLGMFGDHPLEAKQISPLDALSDLMLSKLSYQPGERDMVVLYHDFKAWFAADGHYEKLTSSLVDYGVPNGDSSMARTVSLPAAIAARLILTGKISGRGVMRPVTREIYNPVLDELESLNIVCSETKSVC
ncbi:MAG: saccharopine dehydrogenase (NADP+, L-glutamate forming) [Candidatus Krumholzibacteriia bacterium]